jgi:hypothetical protein
MGRVESRSEIGFVCLPSHAQSAVGPGRQRNIQCAEIIGAGAAAGISDFYYPGQERTWTKTGQGWLKRQPRRSDIRPPGVLARYQQRFVSQETMNVTRAKKMVLASLQRAAWTACFLHPYARVAASSSPIPSGDQ